MKAAALKAAAAPGAAGGGWDRPLITAALVLAAVGFVLALASSPAAGQRMAVGQFHFAQRQGLYLLCGALVFAGAARLSPVGVRRAGVLTAVAALAALCVVPFAGVEVKGAVRWLDLGPVSLQPSELLKPGLVIAWAWLLATGLKQPGFPALAAMGVSYAGAALLLLGQPDVGQTALLTVTALVLLQFWGASWPRLAALCAAAGAAGLGAYHVFDHVRRRVDAFLAPDGADGHQVGLALEAVRAGGLVGVGPGEGQVKRALPDAHSDFIYAVAAEEFGLIASVGLVGLYALIVWRGLKSAQRLVDPFAQLAAGGLFVLFGAQAAIHIGVNLSLLPAKGMTLPFVSYGGSSMLGAALTLGFAVALTRRRPGAYLYDAERAR